MNQEPRSTDNANLVRTHGPWQIVSTREVYRDPWLRVERDEVIRPDGDPGSYCVVHIKPGVSVLAIDADGTAYLTDEFHYAVGRDTLEAVSGGIDNNETPLEAAKRELSEELGITALNWTDLGTVDPFTASLNSPTQLFLARELSIGEANPEGTETIRCVSMRFADVVDKAINGGITHAPSVVLILKTHHFLANEEAI